MKEMPICGILILLSSLLLLILNSVADTGTYQIIDYSVALDPRPNGEVVMDYSQTWQVTGGHIPWVTVGLANANYQVVNWGGAANRVSKNNDGNWYGVRVDLNKDYLPNDRFTYNFTIIQRYLIDQRSDGSWIVFTPGWYDRSSVKRMSIKIASPVALINVTADPEPSAVEGRTLVFIKDNLGMGERFKVSAKFPVNAFDTIQKKTSANKASSNNSSGINWWGVLFVILFVLLAVFLEWLNYEAYADQDYGGPVIYSGGIRRGTGSRRSRSTEGRGGFGGRATSCACVSCACACACACAGGGGGGAGCARKWLHSCNKCEDDQ